MSEQKAHKTPYVPSAEAKEAVAAIVQAFEGLTQKDRAHVRARIGELYFPRAGTTKAVRALNRRTEEEKKRPETKRKTAWKVAWEATAEYQRWQASKVKTGKRTPETDAAYLVAQRAAMTVRAECKARFSHNGQEDPGSGEDEKKEEKED